MPPPATAWNHLPGHPSTCPGCLEARNRRNRLDPHMTFDQAAATYMAWRGDAATRKRRVGKLRATTVDSYTQYLESLQLFFQGTPLLNIGWPQFDAYAQDRLAGAGPFERKRRPQDKQIAACPVKAKKVNQELALAKMILTLAGCWGEESEALYRPLEIEETEIARALSPEEQARWLETARSRKQWELVYSYSILALDTCLSTNEQDALRIGDINLSQRVLMVPPASAKCPGRTRTIELVGAEVLWAAERLLDRAHDLGARSPLDHVFPFRPGRAPHDPSRHMTSSGIKKPWDAVRKKTGLLWFRRYDLRHTGITRHAEIGTPIEIIKSFAGHLTDRMSRHYTHISRAAQRQWREQASDRMKKPSQSVTGRNDSTRCAI